MSEQQENQDLSHIAVGLRALAVPIDSLLLDPANVRQHPERSLDAIKGSLARFRQQKPIVFDPATRVIRAGNGTYQALRALGKTTIAAVPSDLEGSELTAFAIADNRTAELSKWDYEGLSESLRALQDEGFDLSVDLGWAEHEYSPLLAAEWTPPPPSEDMEVDSQANDGGGGRTETKTFRFDPAQWGVISQAIEHIQNECGEPKPSMERALELMAANYLAGCVME